jgi:hypothetical protein
LDQSFWVEQPLGVVEVIGAAAQRQARRRNPFAAPVPKTYLTNGPVSPVSSRGNRWSGYGATMTDTTLHTFRQNLAAVDPASLTGADRRAVLDLLAASFQAAGIE